ncbi:hypothetical protein, partial [Sulfuricurvum sp.]|uniref:hypothetical protein n=1 Tax=Sulfuricurvum sp. TaxID=2025608 RepID=UPI002E2FAEAD
MQTLPDISDLPPAPDLSLASTLKERITNFLNALPTMVTEFKAFISAMRILAAEIYSAAVSAESSKNSAAASELNARAYANYQGIWTEKGYLQGQSVQASNGAFYVCNVTHTNPSDPTTNTTGIWTIGVPIGAIGNINSPLFELLAKSSFIIKGVGSITYACASASTYTDRYDALQSAAINTPRFGRYGYYSEPSSTNLLLNSDTLSTQTVTVVSGTTYTLSFYDTGSVVLSGGGSGTLTGTAAYPQRVELTFVASSTSVTLTVTGTCRYSQLEAKTFASSYIPTTTTSVTRASTVCPIQVSNNMPSIKKGMTFVCDYYALGLLANTNQDLLGARLNANEYMRFVISGNTSYRLLLMIGGVAYTATISKSISIKTKNRVAFVVHDTGFVELFENGVFIGSANLGVLPRDPTMPTNMYLGGYDST